jgi:hypothetical protein
MPRTNGGSLSGSTITYILANPRVILADLIKIEFTSGSVYYTNHGSNLTLSGNTYTADGDLLSLDAVRETIDIRIRSFGFTLSTVNPSNITPAYNTTFEGVPVTVCKAIIDDTGAIIHSWIQFLGFLESFEETETFNTASIRWNATDEIVNYDKLRARRTNSQEQQVYFPGTQQITDGDFSSGASWTQLTGWSVSGGTANCDGTQTGETEIRQLLTGLTPGQGKYILTFDLVSVSAGNLKVNVANKDVLSFRNTPATYTVNIDDNLDPVHFIKFIGDVNFVGSIDNVSLKGSADLGFDYVGQFKEMTWGRDSG